MFDQALRINPNYANAYNNKGMRLDRFSGVVLKNLGKFSESIIMYDQVLRINPNDANAYKNKGMKLKLFLRRCTSQFRRT